MLLIDMPHAAARRAIGRATLMQTLADLRASVPALALQPAFIGLLAWLQAQLTAGRVSAGSEFGAFLRSLALDGPSDIVIADALRDVAAQPLLDRLQDLHDEQPLLVTRDEDGRARLLTLAELEGRPAATIDVDADHERDREPAGPSDIAFKMAGDASAAFRIEVLSAAAAEKRHGDRFDGSVLLLVADGELDAGLKSSLARRRATLGAQASARLTLMFQLAPTDSMLSALHAAWTALPRTLRLHDLAAGLAVPAARGLRRLQIEHEGGVVLDLSTGIGARRVQIRAIDLLGQAHRITTTVAADARLEFGMRIGGRRQLSLSADDADNIVLRSELESTSRHSAGWQVEAGIRLRGWDTVATHLLERCLPDAQPLFDLLAAWLEPGHWLQQRLTAALPDDLVALAPLLAGEGDDVAAALREAIGSAVDTRVDLWQAVLEQRSEPLVDTLVAAVLGAAVDSEPALQTALRRWLSGQLGEIVGDAREGVLETLRQRLQPAVDGSADAIARMIGDTLRTIGRDAQASAREAGELLAPVIGFLSDYSKLRKRLLDAARESLRFRLELGLAHDARRDGTQRLESERLLPRQDALSGKDVVEADFRRWLGGELFHDESPAFGLPPVSTRGHWRASSTQASQSTDTLTIDLGFAGLKARDLLSAKTRIDVGPGGVLVASSRIRASRDHRRGGERTTALGRALFDAMIEAGPLSSFQVGIDLHDAAMQQSELRRVLASLREPRVGLLGAEAEAALWLQWQALANPSGHGPDARLQLGLALDRRQRQQFAALCADAAALKYAIASALVDVCRDHPARDLARSLRTFGFTGDPVAMLIAHWSTLHQVLGSPGYGQGPGAYATLNGVAISPSNKSADLDHPWGAALALRRSIRPAEALLRALFTIADWPARQSMFDRALSELRARPGFTEAAPEQQALQLAQATAALYDPIASEYADDFGRAMASSDVLFDSQDDVPIDTLVILVLVARASGAGVVVKLAAGG